MLQCISNEGRAKPGSLAGFKSGSNFDPMEQLWLSVPKCGSCRSSTRKTCLEGLVRSRLVGQQARFNLNGLVDSLRCSLAGLAAWRTYCIHDTW